MQKDQLSEFVKEGFVQIDATSQFKSYIESLKGPVKKILPDFGSYARR